MLGGGTAIGTGEVPRDSGIFVSVEMSRSKWVIGVHSALADKIALHSMACGDVDALLGVCPIRPGGRAGADHLDHA